MTKNKLIIVIKDAPEKAQKGYPHDCRIFCPECGVNYHIEPWITYQDGLIWYNKHLKKEHNQREIN